MENTQQSAERSEFDTWVQTVRDPAEQASEGVRFLQTANGKATAEYEIAALPDGRYALSMHLEYHSGDCAGHGTPWQAFPTREECVQAFVEAAKRHFESRVILAASQAEAQAQMTRLLEGEGLFGFMEPEISRERTERRAEIAAAARIHFPPAA